MRVFGGDDHWIWLGEDGTLINGISALRRDPRKFPSPFCHVRTLQKYSCRLARKLAHTKHQIWQHLDLELPDSWTVRKSFCSLQSTQSVFFIIAARMDQDNYKSRSLFTNDSGALATCLALYWVLGERERCKWPDQDLPLGMQIFMEKWDL